jgi:hypothetical protein
MTKLAVFTCITGGYDSLRPPARIEPDIDYFCFSDAPSASTSAWTPAYIHDCRHSGTGANRWVKMRPHAQPLLAPYDATLYLDGSIEIIGDVRQFLDECLARREDVLMYEHPFRDCAYEEALACAQFGLDTIGKIGRQMREMRAAGFPAHQGLFEGGVIFRRRSPAVEALMDDWWKAFISGAQRDQLSLPYVAWKRGVPIGNLGRSDPRFGHSYFQLHRHAAARVPLRISLRSRVNRLALAVAGRQRLLGEP